MMANRTLEFAERLDAAARLYTPADRASALFNFIDGLACAHAGYRRPELQKLLASALVETGPDKAGWLVGNVYRARPADAVLLNAMAAHIDDFDDDEALVSIAHVTVPTLCAVLAAADMVEADGNLILDSYLIGVETMVALGVMLNPEHYRLGWHASATLGSFGAAMASAHMLGLSVEEKATALSFAATATSGLRSAFGSSAKPWQVAAAARDGFNAALLAQAGFDSNAALFGAMGLVDLYGGDPSRYAAMLDRVGKGSPFITTGVTIKAYPCCTAAHTAMEACQNIRARMKGRLWQEIQSVEVLVGNTIPSILMHNQPRTALEGKFSMQFCAAAALCLRDAGLSAFVDAQLLDPAVRQMQERVTMIGVPEQKDPFLCNVTVTLSDGIVLSETVHRTKGSPERPFARADIAQKFLSLCWAPGAEAAFERLLELASASHWNAVQRDLSRLLGAHKH